MVEVESDIGALWFPMFAASVEGPMASHRLPSRVGNGSSGDLSIRQLFSPLDLYCLATDGCSSDERSRGVVVFDGAMAATAASSFSSAASWNGENEALAAMDDTLGVLQQLHALQTCREQVRWREREELQRCSDLVGSLRQLLCLEDAR